MGGKDDFHSNECCGASLLPTRSRGRFSENQHRSQIMKMGRVLFAALAGTFLAAPFGPASAQQSIRVGELNSYKAQPAFLEPYKKGLDLAVEEVNAAGGVLGKRLELVSRDDGGNPGDAVRVAEELVTRESLNILAGTFLSNVGLAVTEFAGKNKVFFLAAEKKRWALVYPNFEYGQASAAAFKELLKSKQPDVEFVTEQAPPLGKLDTGAVVQAIDDAKPDAIFNVLFGPDLAKFVREGNTRGVFKDRFVASQLSGEPEYLDPLKDEAPVGWVVTGYPWYAIDTPEHKAFLSAYQKRFNDYPRLGSVVGYVTVKSLAAGIAKAGSTETEKLIAAFSGLKLDGPFGPFSYRAIDHQATMGAYVGKIAVKDGKPIMVDFKYVDGASVLPSDAEVKKLRPATD